MTTFHLTLAGVSYLLPNGSALFSDLNFSFDSQTPTGLVGRNGVGKSTLAQLLAGQRVPSQGVCRRSGSVYMLAQQGQMPPQATVADLLGVRPALAALARIEAGSSDPADFNVLAERWDLRQRIADTLAQQQLTGLAPNTPAQQLSGGQAARVALAGAWLSDADFLILDEPSNHLDAAGRERLRTQLRAWRHGLLVISHDRALLQSMGCIVELSAHGLQRYGGNYAFYCAAQATAQQAAQAQLHQAKHERARAQHALRALAARNERRHAQGERQGKTANQASILLDRQQQRSQRSAGKQRRQHEALRETLDRQVREAAQQVSQARGISVHAPCVTPGLTPRETVRLTQAVLPTATTQAAAITLTLQDGQRVGLRGPNGCGKSTLLRMLAGQCLPRVGECQVHGNALYLDQTLQTLDPALTVLAQLQQANRRMPVSELRTRLAGLGLSAAQLAVPSGHLSGGERLKAALACVLYADPAPSLLLLDEPSNHLDLPTLQALETMLQRYTGTLIVASHDEAFLDQLHLTHGLQATPQGWQWHIW